MGYFAMLENAADLYNSSASLMSESYRGGGKSISGPQSTRQYEYAQTVRCYRAVFFLFYGRVTECVYVAEYNGNIQGGEGTFDEYCITIDYYITWFTLSLTITIYGEW